MDEILDSDLEQLAGSIDELSWKHRYPEIYDIQRGRDARKAAKKSKHAVKISRAIQQMMTERGLHEGPELELFQTISTARGEGFDPHRITVPLALLNERRDLTVAQAVAGGYLVGGAVLEVQDILRDWSVVLQGGVTVEESLIGNAFAPREVTPPTISWQPTEGTAVTPATPSFGQAVLTPKVAIGVMNASRSFMKQVSDPERWLRRATKRVAGIAIDQAVLQGTGASGQPLGVINTPGLSTQAGAALAWAGVLAMKKNAGLASVPTKPTFVTTPTIGALLEAREKAAGSGFILDGDAMAGCRAFTTNTMPSGTMLCGPMSGITVGIWSDVRFEINPVDPVLFKQGIVQVRMLLAMDVAITIDKTAFTIATSIS